jgi:DNA-binding response OmpR family regulator
MPRRFSAQRAKATERSSEWARPRTLEVSPEHAIEVRLETSASSSHRLAAAIEKGTRDFVLTSRDGSLSTVVRLSLTAATITEHAMAGHHVSVDWGHSTVQCRLDRVSLSRTELRLLAALLEGTGRPISRADLISQVWPDDSDAGVDRENALAVYVCTLRKRLAAIGVASALQTVRGHGYQISERE